MVLQIFLMPRTASAREGVTREVEILSAQEILSAMDFA
jgi:hypothetical protein